MNIIGIAQVFILAVGGIGGALVIIGTIMKWRENRKRKAREANA